MTWARLGPLLVFLFGAREGPLPAPPPLTTLPSIPRVHLDVASDHVVVTEVVDLPRGDWRGGDLDLYVAFGAPGTPEAFDAHLVPVGDGSLEPDDDDDGTKLVADRAARRPRAVHELLGPQEMAGMVVHVPDGVLRRALAPGGMAALRLRTLLRLPVADAGGGREVLVRLGEAQSTPLTLGHVQVAASAGSPLVARAEVRLCGKDADPWPLAVEVLPKTATRSAARPLAPIAPVLAVRHPSDSVHPLLERSELKRIR